MAIYYIGSFPPEYGGVTIKNKNLYEALEDQIDLRRIDMNLIKRKNVRAFFRLLWAMAFGKQYLIGLAGQKNRRNFTKLMYFCKRKAMSRSVLVVMAGVVEDMIQAGPVFLRMLKVYRRIYVEFPGMAEKLAAAGLGNVAVYPNGRPRPKESLSVSVGDGPLRCVFFSKIQPEKGVDRILQAAKQLPDVQFHFYGPVEQGYQQCFRDAVAAQDNVFDHGTFTGTSEEVYRELGMYDVLLLPTRCKTEGLPGVLIEAKVAGLASVVTDLNYNREVVTDGVDGIVLQADTAEALCNAIRALDEDRSALHAMKRASRTAAERYFIDVCAGQILQDLKEGCKK